MAVFDDDEHPVLRPADAAAAAPPARQRGRPRKASEQVVADTDQITSDDMALLRAWAQGIAAARAGRHYVAAAVSGDGRWARACLQRLLERFVRAAGELRDREALRMAREFLEQLPQEQPGAEPAGSPVRDIPTLEDFAAQFDADLYTEAELIDLFQEQYGALASPSAPAAKTSARELAIKRKLAILEMLGPRVVVQLDADSAIAVWIREPLAQQLAERVAPAPPTLSELVRWINRQNRWWYRDIPHLGRDRAERIVVWLAEQCERIGVALDARVTRHVRALAAADALLTVRAPACRLAAPADQGGAAGDIVPLEQVRWPAPLLGENGVYRATSPNTLGAHDDRAAVAEWLHKHLDGKSEATGSVYRRAIERLVLWALFERRCPLSSLASRDFVQFREFLYEPPPHWCGKRRVLKYSQDWRPLRGPLSEVAVQQILRVVKAMYRDWRVSDYLAADAAHGVGFRSSRPGGAAPDQPAGEQVQVKLDVSRSFLKEDLEAMRRSLNEMEDGPARRRLRAILLLLLTTGMRRSEPTNLSFGMIEPVREGNQLTGYMKIAVLGKARKVREVLLVQETLQALEVHYEDRIALVEAGQLPARFKDIPKAAAPLLSILREVRPTGAAGAGDSVAAAARAVNFDGRLGGSAIYAILKDFFARVGARDDLIHGQAAFDKASTHWMRHTFAHMGLAEGGDKSLATVQALLGHSNIATTGLYLKAEMGDRVRLVNAMRRVSVCLLTAP